MKTHYSKSAGERGYILLSIMLLVTLMLIALSIELPRIAQQIRRGKEEELMHRGDEYKNAIRKYVRKFGQYPVSLDQLEKANNTRFLRKRYKDPFTGKDDWRLLHQGEVQVNMATGGTAVSGGPGVITGSGQTGGTSSIGQSGIGQSMMSNSIGMSPGQFNTPGQSSGQFGGGIGQPASPIGQSSTFGTPSAGAQPGQPGTDPNAPGGTAASTNGITAASNMPGASSGSPVIGGGPIMGVASTSKLQSIKIKDGKDHYNDWLFWYDPRFDTQTAGVGVGAAGLGANPVGTPASGLNPGAPTGPTAAPGTPGMGPPRISQ